MQTFITSLVKGAGAIVRKGYQTKLNVFQKSSRWDLVTEYDIAAEKYIMDRIRKKFPDHGLLAEESGHTIKAKEFWIIDPIDGTGSFIRGLPQFSICLAFVRNNIVTMSAIYDPIGKELFFSERGKGAFLNGKKIFASGKKELDHAWIAHQGRLNKAGSVSWKKVDRVIEREHLVLARTASAQLSGAYTACGRYDILLIQGLNPWDIAASALLLQESGAKVTALTGKPYRWHMDTILAARPKLHMLISQALQA